MQHCVTNPSSVSVILWVWSCVDPFNPTSTYSSLLNILYKSHTRDFSRRTHSEREREREKVKKLTFGWAFQFPPPSFLVRRHQAVVVSLWVVLLATGQESVLLGRARALTLGAVLCPAGGRASGDPVLHFPLLLFGEAGVWRPVSAPAHVSVVDLCHGRPSHPGVAVAHSVFEGATALNLPAEQGNVQMLTSWQSINFIDGGMSQLDVTKVYRHCCACQMLWHM